MMSRVLLLKQCNLFSPTPCGIVDVLICNGIVIKIAKEINLSEFEGHIVDCKGKVVVPGIIDQHVHIIGGGGENGYLSRIGEITVSECFENGITTVVGMLGTDYITKGLHSLIAKRHSLVEEGLSCYCLTGSFKYPIDTLTGSITDDMLLCDSIIGVKLALSDHRSFVISDNNVQNILNEIQIGSLVTGKHGYACIHVGWSDYGVKPLIDIVKKYKMPIKYIKPTHIKNNTPYAKDFIELGGYLDFTCYNKVENTINNILKYYNDETKSLITISSDGNGGLPLWDRNRNLIGYGKSSVDVIWRTIKSLIINYDFSICDAISLATINVSESLGLKNKGIIAEGKDADIIVVGDDFNPEVVISNGRLVLEKR